MKKKPTMTGYLILEDFKPDEWRNLIMKKGIDAFPKLRKVLVKILGYYYWKDVKASLAYKNLKIMDDIKLNSLKDICDYSIKEHAIYYKENEIPYEFHFIRYGDKGGIIFVKFDHALSDGIGFLGFLMAMSDNYDANLFPQMKEPSIFFKLLTLITNPIYSFKGLIKQQLVKIKNSPFKRGQKMGKKLMYITKKYNFNKLSKIYKPMGISFNDFIMSLISKNYKKYCLELEQKLNTKYELDTFGTFLAISFRPSMPKCLKDFVIDNLFSSLFIQIPTIDNIEKDYKNVSNALAAVLKNPLEVYGTTLNASMFHLFPEFLHTNLLENGANQIEILTSNVPGPKKALYYSGNKVLSIMVAPQQSTFFNNLTFVSYDGEISIAGVSDDLIPADMEVFIKMIEEDISNYLDE